MGVFETTKVTFLFDSGHCNKNRCILHSVASNWVFVEVHDNAWECSALSLVNGHGKCQVKWKRFCNLNFGEVKEIVIVEIFVGGVFWVVVHGHGDGHNWIAKVGMHVEFAKFIQLTLSTR